MAARSEYKTTGPASWARYLLRLKTKPDIVGKGANMLNLLTKIKNRFIGRRVHKRHISVLLKYSTPLKLANLVRCEWARRSKQLHSKQMPYIAAIDVINACNLQCGFCPTGVHRYGRKLGMVSLQQVQQLLDEVGAYLYIANLYNWGEPLLHPQIAEIVHLVHTQKIYTSISTHLSLRNPDTLTAICDAGLDHFQVSIDGATQETYQKYRVGGDLELVLDNLRRVVEYKQRNKRSSPLVEIQFLIFNHNEYEIEAARKLATSVGVDIFRAKPGIDPDKIDKRAKSTTGNDIDVQTCAYLYNFVAMEPDGGLSPCCHLVDKRDDFGMLGETPIRDMWNNHRYQTARSLFCPQHAAKLSNNLNHPCLNCPMVLRLPHLQKYLAKNPNVDYQDGVIKLKDRTITVR